MGNQKMDLQKPKDLSWQVIAVFRALGRYYPERTIRYVLVGYAAFTTRSLFNYWLAMGKIGITPSCNTVKKFGCARFVRSTCLKEGDPKWLPW